ncbi:hypothetical protein [Flavobacterium sp. MDT1-60]|uniref:hypothetical protein n=1 Tax=Flavobacterium sp. MDT1-60 TaxID=1979344 RepID=UPI001786DCF2|nr:hypothetical protein [Flavobacterium sp. MDT1-60]QOG00677.1 hypothetical protein IHE43_12620 [Flavobacterium sp. MDT1-60]
MNFYIPSQIIIASIAGTSVMTLFSYAVSSSARELYKEPVLLTYVLSSLKVEVSPQIKTFLGWLLHYLIGLFFVVIYHYLWSYDIIEMSWPAAFVLGAVSGIIGILSWFFLFKTVPQKPNIDFKGYYIQLFFAHIIFAIVAFFVYKLFI